MNKKIRSVNSESDDDDDYMFTLHDKYPESTSINVTLNTIPVRMIIDSGATCNVVSRDTWEYLKRNNIKCKNSPKKKNLYPYGSRKPLDIAGTFWADISVNGKTVEN